MKVTVQQVGVCIDQQRILEDVSLKVASGEFVGLVGPNGCGKSTLLKTIYKAISGYTGAIAFDNKDIKGLSLKETARQMSVLTQASSINFDFTVQEIVMMGRSPFKKMLEGDSSEDHRIVAEALQKVGMHSLAERRFQSLSGGEQQRVLMARAMVQSPKFMVLDEPTNHLDIKYQLQILEVAKSLNIGILCALHDLGLAAAYCDTIYMMQAGTVVASGSPEEVLTVQRIRDVFGVKAQVEQRDCRLYITYLGL